MARDPRAVNRSDPRPRFGLYLPTSGAFGDPQLLVDIARDAVAAGWDGFFLWDILGGSGRAVADPWTTLAAIAVTTTLTLGPLVTPLPRRRLATLALHGLTLQRLSRGRFVLGAGLGAASSDVGWKLFGEVFSARARGQLFDATLAGLRELWSAQPIGPRTTGIGTIAGAHYPAPESPIPIWLGSADLGADKDVSEATLQRAARCDGFFPWVINPSPARVRSFANAIREHRGSLEDFTLAIALEFEVSQRGVSREAVRDYSDAGVDWLIEGVNLRVPRSPDQAREIARAGPPA